MDLLLTKGTEMSARKTAVVMVAGIAGFSLLTAAAAWVRIPLPFSPVPLTLQTFVVLCSGAFLGGVGGTASQILYLLWGIGGLPVFTGTGAGALYLCGPTGGYLAGFSLAALFAGFLSSKAKNFTQLLACFLAASALVLVCGAAWLSFVTGMSWKTAATAGIVPFIPGDILKSLMAATVFSCYKKSAH
jgi:biotin transport system substrate-specific component